MAYDAVRAQLDKLLGPDRNGPINPSNAKRTPHYTDDSVCKHYLLGFCPNDLHIKHRSEPGSCPSLHSDAAKVAFDKDDAAGKLRRERARWTRELVRECRSILYDEDRKIRGHARRLQETYNATGDLSGLMIRNFDTLKKLGMVSKDAKIRVLSEMDDLDEFDDQSDQPDQPSQNGHRPDGDTVKNTAKKDDSSTKEAAKPCEDDDDDMEGFGIVQVIPASGSPSSKNAKDAASCKAESVEEVDEFGRIKVKKPDSEQEEEKNGSIPVAASVAGGIDDDDDDDDGFGLIKIIPANSNRDDSSDDDDDGDGPSKSPKDNQPAGNQASPINKDNVSPEKKSVVAEKKAEIKEEVSATSAPKVKEKFPSDAPELNDAETQPEDGKEAESESLTPEKIMESFYEAGKGPDGLLMLDKKQSLRVCQCCGGYISLVDAESRLLSHYGGKSHHSLAQLRAKVPELEGYLSNLPSHPDDDPARSGPRHWSGRERDRPRKDDDRYRNGGFPDRHAAGRSRADAEDGRGYGTTTWYSGQGRSDEANRDYRRRDDNRYRGDDRRRDDRRRDDHYRGDGQHGGVDRQRYDDRYRSDRPRDNRQKDGRYRDDRFGVDERHNRDDRYGREYRPRDDRPGDERYYDDRSRNRDGGRYDSGRKRQRSPSPQRSNRRSRRQY